MKNHIKTAYEFETEDNYFRYLVDTKQLTDDDIYVLKFIKRTREKKYIL